MTVIMPALLTMLLIMGPSRGVGPLRGMLTTVFDCFFAQQIACRGESECKLFLKKR